MPDVELIPDPFASWSDEQFGTLVLFAMILCNRGKQPLFRRRRNYVCALAEVLSIEAVRRGVPIPTPPLVSPPEKHLAPPPAL